MTLAEHLAALNAEKLAWMAAGPDRWTGLWVEDLDHWAEIGVFTVAQFKRYDNETMFWEMHKEVFGVRPRHVNLKDMTDEELETELNLLGRMMEDEIKRQEEWEAEEMAYAQEDAEEENAKRDERPLPIDYVACHYQDGWL
jgi:hypothetical protein